MTKEEFEKLKPGDKVYYAEVRYDGSVIREREVVKIYPDELSIQFKGIDFRIEYFNYETTRLKAIDARIRDWQETFYIAKNS